MFRSKGFDVSEAIKKPKQPEPVVTKPDKSKTKQIIKQPSDDTAVRKSHESNKNIGKPSTSSTGKKNSKSHLTEDKPSNPGPDKTVSPTVMLPLFGKRNSDKLSTCDRYLIENKLEFTDLWEKKKTRETRVSNSKLEDFERIRTIGNGSFGRLILFQHKKNKEYYATKVMEKSRIVKMKQVEHTLNEKRVLGCIKHPFVVHLEYSSKDNDNLYLVLPYISGGDLFSLLRKCRKFTEDVTRFYGAQVTLALEYLHHLGLVYRDLKPENIVIDHIGNIRVTDFGFCKMVNKGRTWTLCGTPDYIAPELILTKGHGLAADWWSLGVLLFEMTAGYTPFYSTNQMQIYENIVACKVKYPPNFSTDLKYLIGNLLQPDLSRRFGNLKNGVNDIKKHKWFKNLDWDAMLIGKITPPIRPKSKGPGDTSNFDKYEEIPIKSSSVPKFTKEFEDF